MKNENKFIGWILVRDVGWVCEKHSWGWYVSPETNDWAAGGETKWWIPQSSNPQSVLQCYICLYILESMPVYDFGELWNGYLHLQAPFSPPVLLAGISPISSLLMPETSLPCSSLSSHLQSLLSWFSSGCSLEWWSGQLPQPSILVLGWGYCGESV